MRSGLSGIIFLLKIFNISPFNPGTALKQGEKHEKRILGRILFPYRPDGELRRVIFQETAADHLRDRTPFQLAL